MNTASSTARYLALAAGLLFVLIALVVLPLSACDAQDAPATSSEGAAPAGSVQDQGIFGGSTSRISGNPGAVNIVTGTGLLGQLLGFGKDSGVHLGGLWIGNANYLFAGGVNPRAWSFNSLLVMGLSLDLEKLVRIPGALFGAEFLQFNGQDTNGQAGVIVGYNSLVAAPPLDRSELYQLWWRQQLFDDKLIIRVGKSVPTYDFNNVTRPIPLEGDSVFISALSGLIYTPIFVNPTLLGVLPGYYDSAYGITTTVAPTKTFYISYGIYDGNLARGKATGLEVTPQFNGYYFNIGEMGYAWLLGLDRLPGQVAVGGWWQSGKLSAAGIEENGAQGFYTFGSQRLWAHSQGTDSSAIVGFFQFGINNSETLPVNKYFGVGVTGFSLVPGRAKDSMGAGLAVSWLNENLGLRSNEVMLAAYYQMQLVADIYLQPTVTYVPNPGQSRGISAATAVTLQITVLF